jgi:hypothetical protein
VSKDSLIGHLQTHTCLPFPAGPVVPREYSSPRRNDEFGSSAASRAAAALKLVGRDYDDTTSRLESTATRVNPKSALAGLMRDSFAEFYTRHAEIGLFDESLPVEDQLLTALVSLGPGQADELLAEEYLRRFEQRRTKPRNSKAKTASSEPVADQLSTEKATNSRNIPAEHLPYSSPRYGCTCGGIGALADCLQGFTGTSNPSIQSKPDAYVSEVLAMKDGDWLLLSLFFLKQFHSHLAWVPTDSHLKVAQPFYNVMLRQLEQLARRGYAVAWAGTAAGLQQCLPRLGPYLAPQSRAVRLPAATAAPECFRPDWLGDRQSSLEEACVLLASHGELAAMALDADALALEMAARMTDPTTALQIGLSGTALGYLTNPYDKTAKALLKAATQAGQGLAPSGLNMSPDFALSDFQPRVKRLLSYVNWMTLRGLDALTDGTSC